MEWIIGVPIWLAVGWLPTRILKHFFRTEFPHSNTAWDSSAEVLSVFNAIMGIFSWAVVVICMLDFRGSIKQWGWMW